MCFSANELRHGGAKGKEAALTLRKACCHHTTAGRFLPLASHLSSLLAFYGVHKDSEDFQSKYLPELPVFALVFKACTRLSKRRCLHLLCLLHALLDSVSLTLLVYLGERQCVMPHHMWTQISALHLMGSCENLHCPRATPGSRICSTCQASSATLEQEM